MTSYTTTLIHQAHVQPTLQPRNRDYPSRRSAQRERDITHSTLLEIIDTGETRYSDATHLWAFKHFAERHDNLLCAVLVLEDRLVVKTVMHNFSVT